VSSKLWRSWPGCWYLIGSTQNQSQYVLCTTSVPIYKNKQHERSSTPEEKELIGALSNI
jgi:hypothetical protein